MNWSIKISEANFKLSDIGATSCVLTLKSLACDELVISTPKQSFASINQHVELFLDGARKFAGSCCDISASIAGSREIFTYTFKNAWLDLQEMPFLQEWLCVGMSDTEFKPFNVLKSKNLFGLDYEGKRVNSASHIAEIIDYASKNGVSISLGDCEASTQFPSYEIRDLTCEQALLKILKWSPDIVSYFDYTQNPPALNLKKRSLLPEKNPPIGKIKSLNYAPCRDLQVENVNIIYERTHTIDGETYSSFESDTYPSSDNANLKNCLSFTVELSGKRANTLVQKIEAENIDTDSPDWWKSKAPFLNEYEGCIISIDNVKRVSSLPRELISGTVMEWMLKSVERDIITADVSIYKDNSKILTKKITIKLIATDASNQTYSNVSVTQYSEPTPVGVAKNLYESLCDLQYKGSMSLIDESGENYLASKLKMEGKFENAVVYESRLDLFSKNLTLNFGPQKYLQGADFVELYRIPKGRLASANTSRNSAKEIKDAPIELSPANNQTDTQTFNSELNQVEIVSDGEKLNEIILDPKLIEVDNLVMQPRKLAVVYNAKLAYAYVLTTEAFEEEV